VTINNDLRQIMEKAIQEAETAIGLKAERAIFITPEGEPIHYQFVFFFEIENDVEMSVVRKIIDGYLGEVKKYIEENCRDHFIRIAPSVEQEFVFDRRAFNVGGVMRGAMTGLGNGPARVHENDEPVDLPKIVDLPIQGAA
jgi:hypothetical protein